MRPTVSPFSELEPEFGGLTHWWGMRARRVQHAMWTRLDPAQRGDDVGGDFAEFDVEHCHALGNDFAVNASGKALLLPLLLPSLLLVVA